MAIIENLKYVPLNFLDDPDDYRPNSELAFVIDPARPGGDFVRELTVFCERIAPGDRIPLHQHTIEEVVFVEEGSVEATLGNERRGIAPGAIAFIPSGAAHGFRNIGNGVARIYAVFPAREISIQYLERNQAPGTEGDEPRPPITFDARELIEGDPQKAFRPLRRRDFSAGRP
jgi:quercetin dioxygenase-like cupin family protein